MHYAVLAAVSSCCPLWKADCSRITHPSATKTVLLLSPFISCVRHAAGGSNSQYCIKAQEYLTLWCFLLALTVSSLLRNFQVFKYSSYDFGAFIFALFNLQGTHWFCFRSYLSHERKDNISFRFVKPLFHNFQVRSALSSYWLNRGLR